MKIKLLASFAALSAMFMSSSCDRTASVQSPDGNIEFSLSLDRDGAPRYSVSWKGKDVIGNSALGFTLKDGEDLSRGFRIKGMTEASADTVWEQVWGEEHFVRDRHREMNVRLEKDGREMDVRVRVFDDGFGFRYEFPGEEELTIMDEHTEFAFTEEHEAWWISRRDPYYEGYGQKTAFTQIDTAYTPFTIESADGNFYAIHEAALLDYAKMNLVPKDAKTLKAELTAWKNGVKAYAHTPFRTPWRTVTMTDTPGGLQESRIMLNLNEPNRIEDTEWIRPCKYIGIWWVLHKDFYTWYSGPRHGATTALTKHYIDFAAENGIGAVLVEGWNVGWDGNWMKNSTGFDFRKAYPDYDFDQVMKYAASKGVQVIIHNETAANTEHYFSQIDEAYSLYSRYGMHYVKTGNVNLLMDGKEEHDGQYGVNRLHAIVEKAAEYRICIDEHEPVVPTGVGRTWPNLMTHEAIRGQEHDAWEPDGGNKPEHSTVIPFIRGLAGPSDYTFGTFDFTNPKYPFCRVQTTLAKQLAQYVTIYSPLQMASDAPEAYMGHKAFQFIRDVPVDWEESHTPMAVIGDYMVTVRKERDGEDWYLGAVTDENARKLKVALDFLSPEKSYTAMIYADGPDASWEDNPTSFEYSEKRVTACDSLTLKLATSGGCAIRFRAEKPATSYVDGAAFPVFGKVSDETPGRYRRLPSSLEGVCRKSVWYLGKQSAGLYLRFRSDSPFIKAKWTATFDNRMNHMTDTGVKGLDLYFLNGGKWRFAGSGRPQGKQNSATLVANMEREMREYMLYLPLYDGVDSLQIGVEEGSVIEGPKADSPKSGSPIVMYGTSILQGGCASRPGMAHTSIVERALDREVINLGFSGNALLDMEIAELMARIGSPAVYVLDYVPNASAKAIESKGERFFDILRKAHPDTPVILVEDPVFAHAVLDKKVMKEIQDKNAAQKRLYERLRKRGEKNIHYLAGDALIGDDGEATVDGVHFTDLGAERYVQALLPVLRKAMK